MESIAFYPLFFSIFIFCRLLSSFAMEVRLLRNRGARLLCLRYRLVDLARCQDGCLVRRILLCLSDFCYHDKEYVIHLLVNIALLVQNQ